MSTRPGVLISNLYQSTSELLLMEPVTLVALHNPVLAEDSLLLGSTSAVRQAAVALLQTKPATQNVAHFFQFNFIFLTLTWLLKL